MGWVSWTIICYVHIHPQVASKQLFLQGKGTWHRMRLSLHLCLWWNSINSYKNLHHNVYHILTQQNLVWMHVLSRITVISKYSWAGCPLKNKINGNLTFYICCVQQSTKGCFKILSQLLQFVNNLFTGITYSLLVLFSFQILWLIICLCFSDM